MASTDDGRSDRTSRRIVCSVRILAGSCCFVVVSLVSSQLLNLVANGVTDLLALSEDIVQEFLAEWCIQDVRRKHRYLVLPA